jgi:hypothetical protein
VNPDGLAACPGIKKSVLGDWSEKPPKNEALAGKTRESISPSFRD